MSERLLLIEEAAAREVLADGLRPLCDRIQELEAENARLREEWAQEGIGWLRDKDIDRLIGVEDENKRLATENIQLRKALTDIEDGTILQFDESEEREVEAWMDAEDMQEIARQALKTAPLRTEPPVDRKP